MSAFLYQIHFKTKFKIRGAIQVYILSCNNAFPYFLHNLFSDYFIKTENEYFATR